MASSARLTGIKGGLALNDGLMNVASGGGTGADKRSFAAWSMNCALGPAEIEAAYRTNWLVRKVHDLPPFDMTREWRDWEAEKDQIKLLEAEERKHGIRGKVQRALILARLHGGGALILGLGGTPNSPAPANLTGKALQYVHVVSRYQLTYSALDNDPVSPFFGQPKMWQMSGAGGATVDIHPSRVIPFIGQRVPEGAMGGGYRDSILSGAFTNGFWGDPLLLSIDDAMKDATATNSGVAALILEAKVDTLKIPGLMDLVGTSEGEARLMKRVTVANLMKSTHHTRIIDGEEEWDTRELSFAGLKDLMQQFLSIASAATDIPETRLLGRSPAGMSATGESDSLNYENMIKARQEVDLAPCLDRLDEFLIPSALGSRPAEVTYLFAPLRLMTEKEKADIFKIKVEGIKGLVDTQLVPSSALSTGVQNMLLEDGTLPGLEQALDDAEAAGDIPPILEEPEEADLGEEGVAPAPGESEEDLPPARRAANDALTDDERKTILSRLWDYLIGKPAKET